MDTLRPDRRPGEIDPALLESVAERARERLPPAEAEQLAAFIRQFYRWVPPEDLAGRSAQDLYGAALTHWRLAQLRRPGSAAIRVYNPAVEHDGWQSLHTVIE